MVDEDKLEKPVKGSVRRPARRVSDVIPSGELWPDEPRRELNDLLDKDIEILDVAFLKGRYGEFAIILATWPGQNEQFTTACGGEVVVRKLHDLRTERSFPIVGAISYNGTYYDIQ